MSPFKGSAQLEVRMFPYDWQDIVQSRVWEKTSDV